MVDTVDTTTKTDTTKTDTAKTVDFKTVLSESDPTKRLELQVLHEKKTPCLCFSNSCSICTKYEPAFFAFGRAKRQRFNLQYYMSEIRFFVSILFDMNYNEMDNLQRKISSLKDAKDIQSLLPKQSSGDKKFVVTWSNYRSHAEVLRDSSTQEFTRPFKDVFDVSSELKNLLLLLPEYPKTEVSNSTVFQMSTSHLEAIAHKWAVGVFRLGDSAEFDKFLEKRMLNYNGESSEDALRASFRDCAL